MKNRFASASCPLVLDQGQRDLRLGTTIQADCRRIAEIDPPLARKKQ